MRTRCRRSYCSTLWTKPRDPEKWVPAFAGTPECELGAHHDIVQIFAAHEAVEIGGEIAPAPVGGALGKPRAMRRHQHIRQLVEWELRWAPVGIFRAPVLPPH